MDLHTVRIFEKLDATEEINRVVIAGGVALKESRFAGEDLESYFMERMSVISQTGGEPSGQSLV